MIFRHPITLVGLVLVVSAPAQAQRPPALVTSRSPAPAEAPLLSTAPTVTGLTPAPAQMAGLPLQVGDLPPGTVAVRLIRGEFGNQIGAHDVELHLGADGEVRRSQTDPEGRAHFTGLAVGTPVHAVAIVDGEKLESQSFTLPPRGGVRVMLVAGVGAGAPPGRVALASTSIPADGGGGWPRSRVAIMSALLGGTLLTTAVVYRRQARVARRRAHDREELFAQLIELEDRWAARRIGERRYRTTREALMRELELRTPV